MEVFHDKMRIVQEFVPGKQITIAHIIANPDGEIYKESGIKPPQEKDGAAIGIVNITPPETSVIIGDISLKAAGVDIKLIDRSGGTLIITGAVAEVESALHDILHYAEKKMGFEVCGITKT